MAAGDMRLDVKIDTRKIENALDRYAEFAKFATQDAVEECADEVRIAAVRLMGPVHPRGTPGAPAGAPPFRVSRALSLSLNASRAYISGAEQWSAFVGPTKATVYGRVQELGRASRGRYPYTHVNQHPYLKPARDSLMPHFPGIFHRHYENAQHEALA